MGAPPEIIVIALGSGGALALLASSLRSWLSQPRRSLAGLKLRLEANGRAVELKAESLDEHTQQLLTQLVDDLVSEDKKPDSEPESDPDNGLPEEEPPDEVEP